MQKFSNLFLLPSRTEHDIDYILFKLDIDFPKRGGRGVPYSEMSGPERKFNQQFRLPVLTYLMRLGISTERLEFQCSNETSHVAYSYLRNVGNRKIDITKFTPIISKEPQSALDYVKYFLKGNRFEEAEVMLANRPHYNRIYINLLKDSNNENT